MIENGHAPVNSIDMYYEVRGTREGVPLVLLHGGGSTIDVTFSKEAVMTQRESRQPALTAGMIEEFLDTRLSD